MTRCRDVDAALAYALPLADAALPDALALHIEACPRCAAAFDRAFRPLPLASPPAPPALRQRWLRPSPSPLAGALMAAVVLLGVSLHEAPTPSRVTAAAELPESLLLTPEDNAPRLAWCEPEPSAPQECPVEEGA
ncbi:MAG: hypothetical protein H6739_23725 [Alphaproteobacteria bacterium]|nr:hypothetical protein [Alphaproteobacteria bacterium]